MGVDFEGLNEDLARAAWVIIADKPRVPWALEQGSHLH